MRNVSGGTGGFSIGSSNQRRGLAMAGSIHSVANGRDACTMVLPSRSKRDRKSRPSHETGLGLFLSLIILSSPPCAQDYPAKSIPKASGMRLFGGEGTGLHAAKQMHYAIAGFYMGRIITREHLRSCARGNFKHAGDYMALWEVCQGGHAV